MITDHYFVRTPDISLTWIGTVQPDGEHVWLCAPSGDPLLRVPAEYVTRSSVEETAARCLEDRRHALEDRQAALAARN